MFNKKAGSLFFSLLIFSTSITFVSLPSKQVSAANASDWRAGHIISDKVFTNKDAMSSAQIQNFLNNKGKNCSDGSYPCLKNYKYNGESAATIIRKAALDYRINPQAILVLLEKEQALVTRTSVTRYSLKYATGYCVPDGGPPPCSSDTYTFRSQVRKAASLFRSIINDPSQSNYPPGSRKVLYHPDTSCGRKTVGIETRATSALYHYTPYTPNQAALNNLYGEGNSCSAYGNRNFWRIFTDWFGSTGKPLSYRLIQCGSNKYLVERGIKSRRQIPEESLKVYDLEFAYFATNDPGCYYRRYDLPLGNVIRSRTTEKEYLADLGRSYMFHTEAVARSWGMEDKYNSSFSGLPRLNGSTIHHLSVNGVHKILPRLTQSDTTDRYYFMDNGKRYYLLGSPDENYSTRLLKGYDRLSEAVFSRDLLLSTQDGGELDFYFKIGSTWYLMNHGEILPIDNAQFDRWDSIVSSGPTLTSDVLGFLPVGEELKIGFRRDNLYYRVRLTGEIESTTSSSTAAVWGVDDAPFVTNLLRNKLVN